MNIIKSIFAILVTSSMLFPLVNYGQTTDPLTLTYKRADSLDLQMDIYMPNSNEIKKTALLYVHGGGFREGNRDNQKAIDFCQFIASHGIVAISMSYRLPIKDRSFDCHLSAKEKIETFQGAAMDIHDALAFLMEHSSEMGIDSSKIVIAGSSAGAEACLHAAFMPNEDYATNQYANFKLAGIISMAGAIADTTCITKENAIPSLFFHGTCDNLVPYASAPHHYCNNSEPGYLILHGGYSISQRLKHLGQPFYLYTICKGTHEWASKPLLNNQLEILDWLKTDVESKTFRQINQVDQSDKEDCTYPQYEYCR